MHTVIRYCALIALCSLVFGFVGCSGTDAGGIFPPLPQNSADPVEQTAPSVPGQPEESVQFPGIRVDFSFQEEASAPLTFSDAAAATVDRVLAAQDPQFPYAQYYGVDQVLERLDFDAQVEKHGFCALDAGGVLTSAHLQQVVAANNAQYLAGKPFGYADVDAGKLAELCDLIVPVVQEMLHKHPQLDADRIYCNLGALKILNKPGMLSFALVSKDLVLAVSPNSEQIVLNTKGEAAYRDVLIHEIMHVLQMGCMCEQIPNCVRRAGISLWLTDFPLGTSEFLWLVESSAEQNTCRLSGNSPTTYQNLLAHLHSFSLAVLPRESVAANALETLSFYEEPQLLFDAFGCETVQQKKDLLTLMIGTNVLDMDTEGFYTACREATGLELAEDDGFYYDMIQAIGVELSREFYENLTVLLQQQQVSYNDIFCLIRIFEGQLNVFLRFGNDSNLVNIPHFLESYNAMRNALFAALEQENPGSSAKQLYESYDPTAAGDTLLNATLSGFSAEKRTFLAERAQWLEAEYGLHRIVPFR